MVNNVPVPVAGVDFDNGFEFMNWGDRLGGQEGDPLTRGRPCKRNDNPHVEQCNGDWVRKHAFRYRYETEAEMRLLNELWELVMARKNHLLPCVKATDRIHTAAGRKKRVYDTLRTPCQRLLDAEVLDRKTRARLEKEHAGLNPARITRRINQTQQQLINLASARTDSTQPAA